MGYKKKGDIKRKGKQYLVLIKNKTVDYSTVLFSIALSSASMND